MTHADPYPVLTIQHVRSTDYSAFHISTEPTMVELLETVPGYVETRRLVLDLSARLVHARSRAPERVDAVDVLRDALVERIEQGEALPTDFGELLPTLAAVPVYEGRDHKLGVAVVCNGPEILLSRVTVLALSDAVTAATARLDVLVASAGDRVMGHLTDRLVELVDRARTVLTDRGRIFDADDAIEQDRVEEYQASRELQREYAELRRLQLRWGSSSQHIDPANNGDHFAMFISNPLVVAPWLPRLVTDRPYANAEQERQFLERGRRTSWPRSWLDPEALWWFAEHREAKPWAPTEQQYQHAGEDLHAAYLRYRRGQKVDQHVSGGAHR